MVVAGDAGKPLGADRKAWTNDNRSLRSFFLRSENQHFGDRQFIGVGDTRERRRGAYRAKPASSDPMKLQLRGPTAPPDFHVAPQHRTFLPRARSSRPAPPPTDRGVKCAPRSARAWPQPLKPWRRQWLPKRHQRCMSSIRVPDGPSMNEKMIGSPRNVNGRGSLVNVAPLPLSSVTLPAMSAARQPM